MNKRYILNHDLPEISIGAIVEYNENSGRYVVINLLDSARYPLTLRSRFTFHKDVVEGKRYWFRRIYDWDSDCEC